MSIRLNTSNIAIGNFILEETATGLTFNGLIKSDGFFSTDTPMQGTVQGFTSGGTSPVSPFFSNVIDKFPFASVTVNASDAGDLSVIRQNVTGQSSTTHGYTSGGNAQGAVPASTASNVIDRFPFASFTTATDVGDLTTATARSSGQSSQTHGYTTGGVQSGIRVSMRNFFPFAVSTTNASLLSELDTNHFNAQGQSSAVAGYSSGGQSTSYLTGIYKFPFAVNTRAVNVGNLDFSQSDGGGQSSKTYAYNSGGITQPPPSLPIVNFIQKFPFANDFTSTVNVGNITSSRQFIAGQSSTTHGYNSGANPNINIIDRFPFATDSNASDVGDLTVARGFAAGQQD